MNVALNRVSTGEEIIYGIESENNDTINMKFPMIVRIVPSGPDSYGLGMIPYSPSFPEGIHELRKSHIVSNCKDVPDGLVKAYLQQTSGIQIVSAL